MTLPWWLALGLALGALYLAVAIASVVVAVRAAPTMTFDDD